MDVEIHFVSGRVLRVYDSTVETSEEGLALMSQHTGWMELGDVVFHSRQIECLHFVDPVTDTEEAST